MLTQRPDVLNLIYGSDEYVLVPVEAEDSGAPIDPTGDTVEMAFVAYGSHLTEPDWQTAAWETDSTGVFPAYRARLIPAGIVADVVYSAYVRVTDSPEVPVKFSGYVRWHLP